MICWLCFLFYVNVIDVNLSLCNPGCTTCLTCCCIWLWYKFPLIFWTGKVVWLMRVHIFHDKTLNVFFGLLHTNHMKQTILQRFLFYPFIFWCAGWSISHWQFLSHLQVISKGQTSGRELYCWIECISYAFHFECEKNTVLLLSVFLISIIGNTLKSCQVLLQPQLVLMKQMCLHFNTVRSSLVSI